MISLLYYISIFDIENNTDLISTLLFFYFYTIATTPLFNSQEKTYFSKSNWLYEAASFPTTPAKQRQRQ